MLTKEDFKPKILQENMLPRLLRENLDNILSHIVYNDYKPLDWTIEYQGYYIHLDRRISGSGIIWLGLSITNHPQYHGYIVMVKYYPDHTIRYIADNKIFLLWSEFKEPIIWLTDPKAKKFRSYTNGKT